MALCFSWLWLDQERLLALVVENEGICAVCVGGDPAVKQRVTCELCGNTYAGMSSLKKHQERQHLVDVPEGALHHNIPIDHQGMISRDAPSPVPEEPDNSDPEEPDNLEPATPNLSPNPLCVLVEQLHTSSLSFSSPVSPAENIEQIIIIRTLDNDLCPDP